MSFYPPIGDRRESPPEEPVSNGQDPDAELDELVEREQKEREREYLEDVDREAHEAQKGSGA